MNENAEAIVILCSRLCIPENVTPLEPAEWSALSVTLRDHGSQPCDLLHFSAEELTENLHLEERLARRIVALVGRSASLAFEISKYENMGIRIMTRADREYPVHLKKTLKNACPPLFYYAGDPALLLEPYAGYAGSRSAGDDALSFTERCVERTCARGYGVVSGGAKGVDSAAETAALRCGGHVIEFLADSMLRRLKSGSAIRAIQDGTLLVLSSINPTAGFQAGTAMMRNRFIYAQAEGTVIVKADLQKGGSWTGAAEALRNGWLPLYCWNNPDFPGNMELIRRGAIPIGGDWDGDLSSPHGQRAVQTSFFD